MSGSLFHIGHERVNTVEVVRVKFVSVLVDFDGVIEFWEIVLGYDDVKLLDFFQVFFEFLGVLPFLNNFEGVFKPFLGIFNKHH